MDEEIAAFGGEQTLISYNAFKTWTCSLVSLVFHCHFPIGELQLEARCHQTVYPHQDCNPPEQFLDHPQRGGSFSTVLWHSPNPV